MTVELSGRLFTLKIGGDHGDNQVMNKSKALAATVLLVLFGAAQASARDVKIKGTYSAGKLGAICSNNGGHFFNTAGGGYGCTAGNGNGGTVTCSSKGKCQGWAPLLAGQTGKGASKPTQTKGGEGQTNLRHPVNIDTGVKPVVSSGNTTQGKGGGMNNGGSHHR